MKTNKSKVTWETEYAPIALRRIDAVGKAWGIAFPKAYVELASRFHGGTPNHVCFDTPQQKECMLARLLAFSGEYPIEEFYKDIKTRLPARVFPFAKDPFGNAICFDYRKNDLEPPIVRWNHEVTKSPDKSIMFVADNFTAFLGMLYTPK